MTCGRRRQPYGTPHGIPTASGDAAIALPSGRRESPLSRPKSPPLRFDHKPQSALQAQGFGIEGANLERAAYIHRNDDTVAGDRCRNHPGALGQQSRGLHRGRPSLGAENAIADDSDDDRDAQHGGDPGYQHQPAHPRDDPRLRRR